MEFINDFLNNNWTISILTGLVVFFVTDFYKRIREKKNYLIKVNTVNRELFNSIKMCIPEENMPSPQMLLSMHRSTARIHNVKINDVDSLPMIFDDLIKEIMDSNFLSYDNKINYCEKILSLEIEVNKYIAEKTYEESNTTRLENRNYKRKASILTSAIASVIASFSILIYSFFTDEKAVLKPVLIESAISITQIISLGLLIVTLLFITLNVITKGKN